MSKLSKLEPYRKVIFGLKDKGKSCRIIAEHLKKEYEFEVHTRTIQDYIVNNYKPSVFELKLDDADFAPSAN